jgi:hypothetical protein
MFLKRCASVSSISGGGIAQLVERLNGIQKVRGSTPLTSTNFAEGEIAGVVENADGLTLCQR